MKIVIDDKIPYIQGAFEEYAEVHYVPGSATTHKIVKDADALVTRTRTICNEQLLANTSVKMIATATIGYDHIDTNYCEKAGIFWTNAPGCNSKSVEQYIASVLMIWAEKQQRSFNELCIGVVGVGNVGSKVAYISNLLGMKVLKNDPPRKRNKESSEYVELAEIQEKADIITLHVPLQMDGEDQTYHLASRHFFNELKRSPLVINSCRGEVTDTQAVKEAIRTHQISAYVADCWENEPEIDRELLELTFLATPHIAGYSKDGKAEGTRMSVRAISNYFRLGLNNWDPSGVELPVNSVISIDGSGLSDQDVISKAILHTYDIRTDDRLFRNKPSDFEQQRGDYPVRREFPAYTLQLKNVTSQATTLLEGLGFKLLK
jgi:erythronate-4-phosphate dehydrogenase